MHVYKWCDGGVVHTFCEKNMQLEGCFINHLSPLPHHLPFRHSFSSFCGHVQLRKFILHCFHLAYSRFQGLRPVTRQLDACIHHVRMQWRFMKLKISEPWFRFCNEISPIKLAVIASYGQGAGTVIWLFLSHMPMELLSASDFVLCGDERRLGQ